MKNNKYKKQINKTPSISVFSHNRETVLNNLDTNPEWIGKIEKNPIRHIIKKGKP